MFMHAVALEAMIPVLPYESTPNTSLGFASQGCVIPAACAFLVQGLLFYSTIFFFNLTFLQSGVLHTSLCEQSNFFCSGLPSVWIMSLTLCWTRVNSAVSPMIVKAIIQALSHFSI